MAIELNNRIKILAGVAVLADGFKRDTDEFASMTVRWASFTTEQADLEVLAKRLYQSLNASRKEWLPLDDIVNNVPVFVTGGVWRTPTEAVAHEDVPNADSL